MKKSDSTILLFVLFLALAGIPSACVPSKKLIRPNGLKYIQLGAEMPPEGTASLKGIPLSDTTETDGDYTWRVAMLQYGQGRVLLEEDFYGSEYLSRIRIETPELRLRNGIRVGSTVEDLLKKSGNWFIAPLQKYRLFDFYTRNLPGLHFLVDDPGRDITDPDYEHYSTDQFAPTARIVAIVVL